LILANIREVKLSSPDYANVDSDTAVSDFTERIQHYAEIYQTLDEDGPEERASFVKLIDVGAKVIINRIHHYRQSRIIFFLMNLHIKPRSIFISRVSGDCY
jgi:6-phosphofructo-2-kinase/fructose-2,6-biphosphatase 2